MERKRANSKDEQPECFGHCVAAAEGFECTHCKVWSLCMDKKYEPELTRIQKLEEESQKAHKG